MSDNELLYLKRSEYDAAIERLHQTIRRQPERLAAIWRLKSLTINMPVPGFIQLSLKWQRRIRSLPVDYNIMPSKYLYTCRMTLTPAYLLSHVILAATHSRFRNPFIINRIQIEIMMKTIRNRTE